MEIIAGDQPQHHFVLVHGMNHGAWCWYRVVTLLRLAGHRATALDMAGCGVHPARVDEVLTFEDYSRPLLDVLAALPPAEQAVLVAHSHGGYSVVLAVERFPEKVAASMPAVGRAMAATSDELHAYVDPDFIMDSKEFEQKNQKIKGKPFIFGQEFMAQKGYNMSPPEYRVVTLLRLAGHRATALDMAGCGVHPARVDEVLTFEDYSRPLLDVLVALPPAEQVVLVAHSHGGYSVVLAVERFPEKVAAAVFVAASMPAVGRAMAATSDELHAYVDPDFIMDSKEFEQKNQKIKGKPFIFGQEFMAQKGYNMSPPEDLTLGLMLVRPANSFTTNNPEEGVMRDENLLTMGRYGSARRVYVMVEDDRALSVGFQRYMIAQSPGVEVEGMVVGGADHMVMISRPEELAKLLVRIAGAGSMPASKVNDLAASEQAKSMIWQRPSKQSQ